LVQKYEKLKGNKMKHVEIVEKVDGVKYIVLANAPIVTVEMRYRGNILSYGISYCRPDDEWNPVIGIRHALKKAIEKISKHMPKEIQKNVWDVFTPWFKTLAIQHIEDENKKFEKHVHKVDSILDKMNGLQIELDNEVL
jgi:hypothetical protein